MKPLQVKYGIHIYNPIILVADPKELEFQSELRNKILFQKKKKNHRLASTEDKSACDSQLLMQLSFGIHKNPKDTF